MIQTLPTRHAPPAGDPASPVRRALGALGAAVRRLLAEAARRRRIAEARAALEAMDESMLADIGLTRGDIPFRVGAERPDDPRRRTRAARFASAPERA